MLFHLSGFSHPELRDKSLLVSEGDTVPRTQYHQRRRPGTSFHALLMPGHFLSRHQVTHNLLTGPC
jgi:hypothetical protein